MLSVRESVFESNSSSVHSLTICSKKDFEEWQSGLRYVVVDSKPETVVDLFKDFNEKLVDRLQRNKEYVFKYPDSNWVKNQISSEEKVLTENYTEETFNITLKNFFEIDEIQQNGITESALENIDDSLDHYDLLVALVDVFDEIFNYDSYWNKIEEDYYEGFTSNEKVDGVDVVAFGYYGRDG